MNIIKHFLKNYGILIVSVTFIIAIKIPHLNLPYSWDEAWSYLPAVLKMAENGPSILPASIELLDSKGHPLLFYFIISGWIKLYTTQIWWVRIMPLLISAILPVAIYFILLKHTSKPVANTSVVLFSVQSLFLAQATLILPEVLLTLFLFVTIHYFLLNRWTLFALFATLMVLTKETGLVFAIGFGLFYFFENRHRISTKQFWIPALFLSIPVCIYGLHLLLTYKAHGTFFFNEHLNYLTLEKGKLLRVLKSSAGILFTRYGRNSISTIAILSLIIILFRKKKIDYGKILLLFIIQIILLLIFTSVNFYTYRYMLPAFPMFIGMSMILFHTTLKKPKYLYYSLNAVMIVIPLCFSLTKKGKSDIDFGYAIYLPLHKEMVEFCEKQDWDDKVFAAEFNMVLALRDPFTGYHSELKGFKTQHLPELKNADIVVLDSTGEWDDLPEDQNDKFQLIKRFENKNHWGEIYLRKPVE
jgi:4-amino-4-deoxy-L-arabinose transferase-like glycosyltransferase